MPNWCANYITVTHSDAEQITRFVEAANRGDLFNTFVPCPPELFEDVEVGEDYVARREAKQAENREKYGHGDWYTWCTTNWGTKWDISGDPEASIDGDTTAHVSFDTAWGPPIAFYDALVDFGFTVDGIYTEEGMCFCGVYETESGDEYFEYDPEQLMNDTEELWKKEYPDDLHSFIENVIENYSEMTQDD